MEPFEYDSKWSQNGQLTPEAVLWILALVDYINALEARIAALESP